MRRGKVFFTFFVLVPILSAKCAIVSHYFFVQHRPGTEHYGVQRKSQIKDLLPKGFPEIFLSSHSVFSSSEMEHVIGR